MSAPNNTYDPVRVAVLAPAEVERMTEEGLAAIAAAATFDDLKAAEVAHRGRQAPLTLASAEIGALPPGAKAEAGRRVGLAQKRLAGGAPCLAPAVGQVPGRRPLPRRHAVRPAGRRLHRDGLRDRRGA